MDTPVKNRHADIPGWGADLDPERRPGYPMERTPPRLDPMPEGPVEQQPLRMKVFHSTERPGVTSVFGTSTPPSGLSGRIRGVAYQYSENDLRHWLLLLFADRVNMVEGLVSDLARGHVPNLYREMGGPAELKYNRAGAMRKAAVAAGVIAVGYLLWANRRKARRR
ncbi:MAG: hypothetical protein ACJ8G7_01440 [Rhizobacter sp.]